MAEQLKTLKRSRTMHKVYTRKIVSETEKLLKSNARTGEELFELEDELVTSQKLLTEKLNLLKGLDEKISNAIEDEDELEKEIHESGDFQRYVLKTTISINSWLKRNSVDNASTITTGEPRASSFSGSKSARLPKLTLQRFSGDPLSFQAFWDSFESAVHSLIKNLMTSTSSIT